MRTHLLDRVLAAQENRGEVDLLDTSPRVEPRRQDRVVVGWGDARVVERDIETAEVLHREVEQASYVALRRHVGGKELTADLLGRGSAGGLVDVGTHDAGA